MSFAELLFNSFSRKILPLFACFLIAFTSACSKGTAPPETPVPPENPAPSENTPEPDMTELAPPAETPAKNKAPDNNRPVQLKQAMPESAAVTWVLDGTDLQETQQAQRLSAQALAPWEGRYRSEQGGSILHLVITASGDNSWALKRNYSEPGMPTVEKSYQLHLLQDGLVSRDANIAVKKTNEGVMVLELDSGIDSIPASYWVHYTHSE